LPLASTLNFRNHDLIANRALTGLGAGDADLATPPGTATQVIIDIAGWFGPLVNAPTQPSPRTEPGRSTFGTSIPPTRAGRSPMSSTTTLWSAAAATSS
jgi:hypothetical protein